MSTFIGNIDAKIDDKGRIFIPATYRRLLPENESKHIVMRRDTDNECLVLYPEHVWNAKVTELKEALDEWNPEDQLLLMQFMSDAQWLDIDSQGRVLLDKRNLQSIGAEKELVFVGMMDRFALWDKKKFSERRLPQADFAARLKNRMLDRQKPTNQ
ncbi:MAG: cell division/cell wall cluster transcriptional repressor MraZ [Paludibacteraceae bacterium]|nr:cell division/cell wall cluster transcriptional repressor MraZ [Paludibacteraceae bacterium]